VIDKADALNALTGAESWTVGGRIEPPPRSARQVLSDAEVFVPLADLIDVEAERERLNAELAEVEADLAKVEATLANPDFLSRAPAGVVDKEREKEAEFRGKRERLRANLASLGG